MQESSKPTLNQLQCQIYFTCIIPGLFSGEQYFETNYISLPFDINQGYNGKNSVCYQHMYHFIFFLCSISSLDPMIFSDFQNIFIPKHMFQDKYQSSSQGVGDVYFHSEGCRDDIILIHCSKNQILADDLITSSLFLG